jgi:hypothetical protein
MTVKVIRISNKIYFKNSLRICNSTLPKSFICNKNRVPKNTKLYRIQIVVMCRLTYNGLIYGSTKTNSFPLYF